MSDHGLTEAQLDIIRRILMPFAGKIECAGLFGSRATGKHRPNSDIDLVVYGSLSADDIGQMKTQFDESYLPVKVDLVAYSLVTYAPFKEHIDNVMKPLFARADLRQEIEA